MTKVKLNKEDVLHIARLCSLELSEDEIKRLSSMLGEAIDYIKILQELPTDKVAETYQVTGQTNVFQGENEPENTLTPEEAVANAKEVIRGMIATKAVFNR